MGVEQVISCIQALFKLPYNQTDKRETLPYKLVTILVFKMRKGEVGWGWGCQFDATLLFHSAADFLQP